MKQTKTCDFVYDAVARTWDLWQAEFLLQSLGGAKPHSRRRYASSMPQDRQAHAAGQVGHDKGMKTGNYRANSMA